MYASDLLFQKQGFIDVTERCGTMTGEIPGWGKAPVMSDIVIKMKKEPSQSEPMHKDDSSVSQP